jgi:photosystem II stability/assembly factor-like uncharacterized protein
MRHPSLIRAAALALSTLLLGSACGSRSSSVRVTSIGTGGPDTPLIPRAIGFFDTRHGVLAKIEDCSASYCPGALFVSDDSGRSWKRTLVVHGQVDITESPVDIDAVRGSSLVWVTTASALLRSDDRGRSWWRALRVHAVAVSFSDPEHGWLLLANGTFARPPAILSSDDGGQSWHKLTSPCQGGFGIPAAISRASASLGWVACMTQMTAGFEGKQVWQTSDGGHTWRLRSRTELFVPRPAPPIGNLPGRGYVSGMQFLPDGRGWLWEDRGWLLTTSDGGRLWRKSPLTSADEVEARSASLLGDRTGFILLGVDPACHNRLVLSADGARRATTLKRWPSTFEMCS